MADQKTVLIAEDDAKTASLLADYLTAQGYLPTILSNGLQVPNLVRQSSPAAILLDLNLPGCDGVDVCRQIRTFSAIPILMLTARVDEIARVLGLEAGADDYVCKPFSPREVMARLDAVLRRTEGALTAVLKRVWFIDSEGMRIGFRGQWLSLTPVEFRLLKSFVEQPERVFARDQLLDRAHEDFRDVSDRAIDSHIKNIRKKMAGVGADPEALCSVYGVGYRYSPRD